MAGDLAAFELAGIPHELAGFAEIDPAACAVLAQKYPNVPNLGDLTTHQNWSKYHGKIDIITAGLPCQPHSTAGRRRGCKDPRELTGAFCDIVEQVLPEWLLIENVPAYKTSKGGAYLHLNRRLRRLGYQVGDRVIDARRWLPQRRERLWILCHRGTAGRAPSELLALTESGAWVPQTGGTVWLPNPVRGDGSASVYHPSRLGTLTATGSGLIKPGMKGAELDFLVVQDIPGVGLIVRRPTPLEALRAQGFPDDWLDGIAVAGRPLSRTACFKLIGNAWPVPVAARILGTIGLTRTGLREAA